MTDVPIEEFVELKPRLIDDGAVDRLGQGDGVLVEGPQRPAGRRPPQD